MATSDFALGLNKLFLRAGKGAFLEELVHMDTKLVIPMLTAMIAKYERQVEATRRIVPAALALIARRRYQRIRIASARIARVARGATGRRRARELCRAHNNRRLAAAVAARRAAEPEQSLSLQAH